VIEAVVRLRHGGGAALGRHGVAAHGIDLGDERHGQRWLRFGHRDRGAQARAARSDDGHVCFEGFHSGQNRSLARNRPVITATVVATMPGIMNEWLRTYLPIRVVPDRSKLIAAISEP